MPFIADAAFDAGLAHIVTNATLLHLCTAEPATFAAVAGASLGSSAPTFGAAADHPTSGRQRTVTAIAAATYANTGTVAAWALVSGSVLLATGAITPTKAVNASDPIATPTGVTVSIADAVAG